MNDNREPQDQPIEPSHDLATPAVDHRALMDAYIDRYAGHLRKWFNVDRRPDSDDPFAHWDLDEDLPPLDEGGVDPGFPEAGGRV